MSTRAVTSTTTTRTTRIGAVRTVIQGVKRSSIARYTPKSLQGADSLAERLNNTLKMLQSYERLKAGSYCRYMDDFLIISTDRDFLIYCQEEIGKKLEEVKLWLHPDKTRIYPLGKGIKFLGFTFKLTRTGKVIRLIDPKNVKHERKRLYKMAQMVKSGERTKGKFYQCYNSWKAHARLGNTYRLLQRMDEYVKSLLAEGKIYEDHSTCGDDSGTAESGQ